MHSSTERIELLKLNRTELFRFPKSLKGWKITVKEKYQVQNETVSIIWNTN